MMLQTQLPFRQLPFVSEQSMEKGIVLLFLKRMKTNLVLIAYKKNWKLAVCKLLTNPPLFVNNLCSKPKDQKISK